MTYVENELKAYWSLEKKFPFQYSYLDELLFHYPSFERAYRTLAIQKHLPEFESLKLPSYLSEKKEFESLFYLDEQFPEILRQFPGQSRLIYAWGKISYLREQSFRLAVVGTRDASAYALDVCAKIIAKLKCFGENLQIVSGLAWGVDAQAHRSALDDGIKTIAVLPCGIDQIYPKRNEMIFLKMRERELLISQFSPENKLLKFNFPLRNQIIAALCDVLLLVEAPVKSGALITAKAALEMGKDVFVVPGSYLGTRNRGGHELVNQGAFLLSKIEEIVERGLEKLKKPCKTIGL